MFDMFEFYDQMKAEDAAAALAALKAKEEKKEADYSPEPETIEPVKKEETVNRTVKEDNPTEPKPIEKPIEGE